MAGNIRTVPNYVRDILDTTSPHNGKEISRPGRGEALEESATQIIPTTAEMRSSATKTSTEETTETASASPGQHSVAHIYNYAARFNDVPFFTYKRTQEGNQRAVVEIKKLGLATSAVSQYLEDAQSIACAKLKMLIEREHAKTGAPALNLRDGTTLNVDIARQFMTFLETTQTGVTVRYRTTFRQSRKGGRRWQAQVVVNKKSLTPRVFMDTNKDADAVAALVAAVRLVSAEPDLFPRFREWMEETGGVSPPQILPLHAGIDFESACLLDSSLEAAGKLPPPHLVSADFELDNNPLALASAVGRRAARQSTTISAQARSAELKAWQESRLQDPQFRATAEFLEQYPVNKFKSQILKLVKSNPQVVITSSAGSGKSTLIPQILLDAAIADGRGASCNIICTQPRRTAALALAHRVAEIRHEYLGATVGYSISGSRTLCQSPGSITYCTSEVLTRQLERDTDTVLEATSHIIVDEVHMRDKSSDRLLATLKLSLGRRLADGKTIPKVILMSGSLFGEQYSTYFELTDSSKGAIRLLTLAGTA